MLFGSDHFGAVRIKVKHGLFNALTSHYRTDQETFNVIQQRIAGEEDEQGGGPELSRNEPPPLVPPPRASPLPHLSQEPEQALPPEVPPAPKFDPFPDVAPLLDFESLRETAPARQSTPPPERKPACENRPKPAELCADFTGMLAAKDDAATEQWRAYSQAYRQRREDERLAKQIEADEVESHRFALGTIHESWQDLLAGKVPALAEDVWSAMQPGKSVHALAEDVQAPLRECLFWLSVFKRFLDVWVDDAAGTYMFRRPEGAGYLHVELRQLRREI